MSFIILKCIESNSKDKSILDLCTSFETPLYSVKCLCESKCEESHESNQKLDLKDRNWNWKDPNFRYSPSRSEYHPGYVGSYAMDAMACVYTFPLFEVFVKFENDLFFYF